MLQDDANILVENTLYIVLLLMIHSVLHDKSDLYF